MTYYSSFAHDFKVIEENIEGIESALIRMQGARDDELLKRFNNLRLAPKVKCRGFDRYLESGFKQLRERVTAALQLVYDDSTLLHQIRNAVQPHVKQKIRIKAIRDLMEKRTLFNEGSLFTTKIVGKMKIPEFAKPGKKPRLLGDFTTEGSLLAAFLVPLIKHAMSGEVKMGDSTFAFCYSTDPESLDSALRRLFESSGNYYLYFSDDMVAKVDGTCYNLDISSCDMSNDDPVFDRLIWLVESEEHRRLLSLAADQCKLKYVIGNSNDPTEKVTAQPRRRTEFSGTQLTTLLNNIASFGISMSIEWHGMNTGAGISESALAVGYSVTTDLCTNIEDVQFLKHHFYYDEQDKLQSCLNIGPLLRCYGSAWGDVPYSRKRGENLKDAMRARNRGILMGYKHSGLAALTENLLRSDSAMYRTKSEKSAAYQKGHADASTKVIGVRPRCPLDVYARRYNYPLADIIQFIDDLKKAKIGSICAHPFVTRVLAKDYGMSDFLGVEGTTL